jgi:hypothetical protein
MIDENNAKLKKAMEDKLNKGNQLKNRGKGKWGLNERVGS